MQRRYLSLESRAVIDLVNIPSLDVCFEVFDGAQVFRFGLHRLEIKGSRAFERCGRLKQVLNDLSGAVAGEIGHG